MLSSKFALAAQSPVSYSFHLFVSFTPEFQQISTDPPSRTIQMYFKLNIFSLIR